MTSGDQIEDKGLVITTLNGLPPSWESFIQTISGRTKLPKFDKLWEDYTQDETRIVARQRLHGSQVEQNQAFITHAKKGTGKGRKFHKHKHQSRRPSSSPYHKEKKDLSHIQCYKCNKYGHNASQCNCSSKRMNEASTVDVDEDTPHKKSRNDDRSVFFQYSPY